MWIILIVVEKQFVIEIVRNGYKVVYNYVDGRGNDLYFMIILYINIKMIKGDKVWIRICDNVGQFVYGGYYCNFFGVKVQYIYIDIKIKYEKF